MSKNKAAQALGLKRWADTTPLQRSEAMRKLALQRANRLTPLQRQQIASLAGSAPHKSRGPKPRS